MQWRRLPKRPQEVPALESPASATLSGPGNLTPSAAAPKLAITRKPLTRAQKLAKALKACARKRAVAPARHAGVRHSRGREDAQRVPVERGLSDERVQSQTSRGRTAGRTCARAGHGVHRLCRSCCGEITHAFLGSFNGADAPGDRSPMCSPTPPMTRADPAAERSMWAS